MNRRAVQVETVHESAEQASAILNSVINSNFHLPSLFRFFLAAGQIYLAAAAKMTDQLVICLVATTPPNLRSATMTDQLLICVAVLSPPHHRWPLFISSRRTC